MSRLVIATGNPDKLREIAAILADVETVGLVEFPDAPSVEETGDTLEANALLKAQSAAEHTGLPSAADDSGLFVDALGGAPGARAARYSGPGATYRSNNEKLLAELENVPAEKRAARFACAVALAAPGRAPLFFRGELPGRIIETPRGQNGFGYDPLFEPENMKTTLAEMSAEAKNAISHRSVAFRRLAEFLRASTEGSRRV